MLLDYLSSILWVLDNPINFKNKNQKKMKKILSAAIFFCFLSSSIVFSQVQLFGTYSDGKIKPDVNIFVTKKISDKVKFTAFGLIEEKWAEGLVGVAYSPTDYLEIGTSIGIEQNQALYRIGGSVWIGQDKLSLLVLGEKGDGSDNYWYKGIAKYQVSETFSTGIMGWRFTGVGPFIETSIKQLDSKIWLNPTYDLEKDETKITLGIDIKI